MNDMISTRWINDASIMYYCVVRSHGTRLSVSLLDSIEQTQLNNDNTLDTHRHNNTVDTHRHNNTVDTRRHNNTFQVTLTLHTYSDTQCVYSVST